MEQRSESWYAWRGKGIGSSDAPIIMGVSPWSTRRKLWLQKTGREKNEFKGNWATERGNELEPKARAMYELQTGYESPPILTENPEFPFIRASLDGYYTCGGVILEIKCPGKADHELALAGFVPEKYIPQIQHQFLAKPEAKKADYFSFDGSRGVIVEVWPDEVYLKRLLWEEKIFWDCIINNIEPNEGVTYE